MSLLPLLGETANTVQKQDNPELKFVPNYIRNPPINGSVDGGPKFRTRHTDFASMPTTTLPAQNDGKLK